MLLKQHGVDEGDDKSDFFPTTKIYHSQLEYEEENEDMTVEAITAEELFVNLISSLDLAEWATKQNQEIMDLDNLLKKLGAVATLTVDRDTVVIRLEVLISAL